MDPGYTHRALKFMDSLNLDAWVRTESRMDYADPGAFINWVEYDTPQKREGVWKGKPWRDTGFRGLVKHPNMILAQIEEYVRDREAGAAITIQKWVRGVQTRTQCGMHNPYCPMGRTFIMKMFEAI